jgi:hypothetical protein
MFQHFGQRLKRDLKLLVDRRLEASAVSSKSTLKVCAHIRLIFVALITSWQSSGVEVDVISHKRQRYAVWFGGSLLASLVSESLRVQMVADASHSPSSTPLVIPRHSTMRLGRVLDVVTRFSAARLRCMQFVLLNYAWAEEDSIINDGESSRVSHSRYQTEKSWLQQRKKRCGYWMSIIHAKMK